MDRYYESVQVIFILELVEVLMSLRSFINFKIFLARCAEVK